MKITDIINKEYENCEGEKISEYKKPSCAYSILVEKYQLWLEECDRLTEIHFNGLAGYHRETMVEEKYSAARRILSDISSKSTSSNSILSKCTPEDIFQLSKTIVPFEYHEQFYESGLFFSSLINMHYSLHKNDPGQMVYQLNFEKNEEHLFGIGYCLNGASLFIQGNCGNCLGNNMQSGHITLRGNAKHEAGARMNNGFIHILGSAENDVGHQMYGGEIIIEKNTENFLGERIFGGKITVKGNSGSHIGRGLNGGVIYIEGNYEKEQFAHTAQEGKIFHKGKLIFHKEKQTITAKDSEEIK